LICTRIRRGLIRVYFATRSDFPSTYSFLFKLRISTFQLGIPTRQVYGQDNARSAPLHVQPMDRRKDNYGKSCHRYHTRYANCMQSHIYFDLRPDNTPFCVYYVGKDQGIIIVEILDVKECAWPEPTGKVCNRVTASVLPTDGITRHVVLQAASGRSGSKIWPGSWW
jgi:hypothetical protein